MSDLVMLGLVEARDRELTQVLARRGEIDAGRLRGE